MTRRGAVVWAVLFIGSNLITYEATRTHMERTVIPAAVANEKFRTMTPDKTVCRVYINQDGMLDVSSPDGEVELYVSDNNVVVGDSDDEEEE